MNFPHFVRIEQEASDGSTQYFVVHTRDPKMAVKFSVEMVNGKMKPGTLLSLAVPNSWAGQYSQYSKLLSRAEAFFRASLMNEDERAVQNRLER